MALLNLISVSTLLIVFLISFDNLCIALPIGSPQIETARLQPRQFRFQQNPDGSLTASIAASKAINIPGQGSANFGIADTINIGPHGSSFDGGQSFSSDFGGNKMSFGQTNSQNSRQGPQGFSSSGGNSASNSFQNPFFQSSNAQANAFANQFNQSPFQRNFK